MSLKEGEGKPASKITTCPLAPPIFSTVRAGSQPTPHPVDSRRWLIDLDSGQLGTNPYSYAVEGGTGDVSGDFPTSVGFLGSKSSFRFLTFDHLFFDRSGLNNSSETELKRHIRLRTAVGSVLEDPATAATQFYDRDDTTMNALGTFSSDWGAIPSYDPDLGNAVDTEDEFFDAALPSSVTAFRDPAANINA